VAPANVQDCKLLRATIEAIVVERPAPSQEHPHQLCLDKAYDNPTSQEALADQNYISPIRRIGEQPPPPGERKYPARRWVVERTIAWLSKCRAILVRYDKKPQNYLGLLQLACALLWYRRLVAASDTS
jgi:putative transposase